MPTTGMPSFSRMKYSPLRWARSRLAEVDACFGVWEMIDHTNGEFSQGRNSVLIEIFGAVVHRAGRPVKPVLVTTVQVQCDTAAVAST
jgi:hypothetical protein